MKSTILRMTILVAMMIPTLVNAQSVTAPYQVGTWKDFKPAAVSYTFDDNLANQITTVVPLLNQYGYTATFYIVTSWSPNWAQYKVMANAGHEIGSHTVSHTSLNTLSTASQQTELANSQSIIASNIGIKPLTLAYPNCNAGDATLTSQYYIAARNCSGQINSSSPADFNNISSIITGSQGSVQTADQFNSKASSAVSSKGWLVWLTHEIDNGSGYSPTSSSAISGSLQYLNQNSASFWVCSFVNVVKYIKERNAATVSVVSDNGSTIVLSVTDNLDNTIYNYPISIRRPLPSAWTGATVTQGGAAVTSSIVTEGTTTYLVFSAVPNKGNVTITSAGNTNIAVTGVTMAPTTVSVNVGATTQLTATVAPSNASNKSVSWTSSNTAAATVSSTGVVTGVAIGTATITVSTTDGLKTATCLVTIGNTITAVTGVTLAPATASVNIGATTQLTATVAPANATNKTVSWTSSNTAVATVGTTGLVTGVATGSAIITVTTVDQAKTATSSITVTPISTTPCSNPVAITIPFKSDGIGEYCWSTTQVIAYVNSWNMDLVEINGVNYTNKWSNSMPAAINGSWYIHYKGSVAWAHFEASATKSDKVAQEENTVALFPNPFATSISLRIANSELISEIDVIDQTGKVVEKLTKAQISETNQIGNGLLPGMYMVKVVSQHNTNSYKIIKQ